MSKILSVLIMLVLSAPVLAQETECTVETRGYYYQGTGTVRTVKPDNVTQIGPLRSFGITSPVHKDLYTCREAVEFLKARTNIVPSADGKIKILQQISYEADCLAVEICPADQF